MVYPTWGEFANLLMAVAILANVFLQIRQGRKLEVVHKATNSMHDEIVNLTRAEGVAQGRAQEAAATPTTESPLPVADDRTAHAAERTATAAEASAKATTRVADAAEIVSRKSSSSR